MNGILRKRDLAKLFRYYLEKFPSAEAFTGSVISKTPSVSDNAAIWNRIEGETKSGERGRLWYGVSSLEEILEAGKGGWKEGLRLYHELKSQIPIEEIAIDSGFSKRRRKRIYGEEGGDIDVCRYINKEYETMFIDKKLEKAKGGKYITIWTSPSAHCGIVASQMIWRGISAVILTDILENAGYRVCLKSYAYVQSLFSAGWGRAYVVEITLKNFSEPLNTESNLIAAGCPAFYRYYLFKHQTCLREEVSSFLGRPQQTIPDILAEEGDVMLGDMDSLNSEESAVQTVKNILKQLNERGRYEE